MKPALLAFIGVCAVGATAGNVEAQTALGGTDPSGVTGGRPDVAPPAVTRKIVQINGIACESSPGHGQSRLICK